ncbi:MAG: phosphoribosylformylglycinamidine synthase [Dehalococcoidia bacterium]|nr:phosphoribosylformylglycinamidine synthase [Dehalococcoidia bacterium]
MHFRAEIKVELKKSVNDPQGTTVLSALHALGFEGAFGARIGKFITIDLDSKDRASALTDIDQMCQKLLANPVIESYEISITNS